MLSPVVLDKVRDWRNSALLFATEAVEMKPPNPGIPAGPSRQQIELLRLFGTPGHKKITIRSGHGTGKDTCASWCIMQFFFTRPKAKIFCTAPTGGQLRDILWPELTKWINRSCFKDQIVIQKDKIYHKDAPGEWFIRALTWSVRASAEDQAETLAGRHADHLLFVIDEASGVPDPVFTPVEGALTQDDNHVLMIGNMTKNQGYFYDSHFHSAISKHWTKLHWDSRESTNVTAEMIEYFAEKYGTDSNIFNIRVKGNPPTDSEDTLISLADAIQCVGSPVSVAEDEPTYLGVDVARYGEDASVILPRRGLEISPWHTYQGQNTINLGGHIISVYAEEEAEGIGIDEIGVGAGVTDWLYKHGSVNTHGINVATASSDIAKAHRLRDELWLRVRDKCQKGLYSFPDVSIDVAGVPINLGHELANELSIPRYDYNAHGGIVVESKKNMKKRGHKSPNIADALCLTEFFHDIAFKLWPKKKKQRRYKGKVIPMKSWMAV